MKLEGFFGSKFFKIVIVLLAELVLVLAVFKAGMEVGFHKAVFSSHLGDNYQRLFGSSTRPKRQQFMGGIFQDRDAYTNANAVAGAVLTVSSSTISVKGNDGVEKSISITPSTTIRKGRQDVALNQVVQNDQVVAIGIPSSTGQIEATFIRDFSPVNQPAK